MDPLARVRSFPKAPSPNHDASAIRGNLTLEQKQLNANILAYHVQAGTSVFQSEVLKDLKLVEVNLRKKREGLGGDAKDTDALEGEMVCEIEVKESEYHWSSASCMCSCRSRYVERVPRNGWRVFRWNI